MNLQGNVFYQQFCDDNIPPEDYQSELWASERKLMQIDGEITLQADNGEYNDADINDGQPLDFN